MDADKDKPDVDHVNKTQNHEPDDASPSSHQPPVEAPSLVAGSTTEPPSVEEEPTLVAPDLVEISQEIDQFISRISSTSKGGQDRSEPPEFLQQFAVFLEAKVAEYESDSKRGIHLIQDDSSSFMESVKRTFKLIKSLSQFSSEEKYAATINQTSDILHRAMSFMELQFKKILDGYQTSHDRHQKSKTDDAKKAESSSSSSNVQEIDHQPESESKLDENDDFLGYSDETILNLDKLAKAMISGGHETESCQLYFFVRRNAVEQNLQMLGFEKLCIDEVQKMQWEQLERDISAWMKTFKDFATSLLPSERRLADAVFSDVDDGTTISRSLFSSLSRGVMFNLVNFAEAVSMTKRSGEKLFKFLDIYETLRDRIPEMETLLSVECIDHLKSEASSTQTRLGEAIFNIFGELEKSIKADTAKTPVPGGAVHPLTRYTMNYLKYACEYRDTLDQVLGEHTRMDGADSATGADSQDQQKRGGAKQSPFQVQLRKAMDLLDANLESKSKLYKDPSLRLIFMMNNGRYILQKVKGTGGISSLLGDTWVRKRSSDLRSYHTNYKRGTWTKLLQCLNHEGLTVNGKVVKPVLKERFKSFNAMFDEIHRTQSTWVVSDEQLQSELRVSISAIVIPAYRSFVGRFGQTFTPGRQTEKYIKYQPEDIETCIEELFDGSTAAPQGKRR